MHPAWSVILFTTLSGSGYGLLAVLGVLLLAAPTALPAAAAWSLLVLGSVLAASGLLCSLGHLGQPQRAWRALSQWRSSWLSREGVAALASVVPILLAASALGGIEVLLRPAGIGLLVAATATVYCTARIYTSLPPVPAWQHPAVAPGYLLFAAAGGLLWALPLTLPTAWSAPLAAATAAACVAAIVLKRRYWRAIDTAPLPVDLAAATGVRAAGLRPLEAPHTEANYLLREMGFVLARRHAVRLRRICQLLLGSAALLALLTVPAGSIALLLAVLAAVAGQLGILVERWLFFAQARHVVTVYYGASGDPARVGPADFTAT